MQQIQFTGHNIELTQTLRDFVAKKFKRLQRYADNITSIHIVFNVEKVRQIAEAKIHIPNSEIYAQAESEDMYKTVDLLIDKLTKQLKKARDKK